MEAGHDIIGSRIVVPDFFSTVYGYHSRVAGNPLDLWLSAPNDIRHSDEDCSIPCLPPPAAEGNQGSQSGR